MSNPNLRVVVDDITAKIMDEYADVFWDEATEQHAKSLVAIGVTQGILHALADAEAISYAPVECATVPA